MPVYMRLLKSNLAINQNVLTLELPHERLIHIFKKYNK